MAQPLAACLAVFLAFQASAQPGRHPQELKAELTRSFADGSDVSTLEFSGQAAPLILLFDQAKYVQLGREAGDEKETYVAFIRSVARRLGTRADKAVERYGDRVRPARAAAAAKQDLQRELDARAALAEDVRRNPGISAAKKARVARDLRETSAYLKSLGVDANVTPAQTPAALNVSIVVYDDNGVRSLDRILPRVQPVPLVTHPTPSPETAHPPLGVAERVAQSWQSLTSYFDWERGKKVATEAFTGTLNYVSSMGKMCYMFVKQALIDAHVLNVANPESTGLLGLRPDAAAMFSQDVKRNPRILDKMGYRQIDLGHVGDDPGSVPDGSLLIYAAGCSFANEEYGHAEITVSQETYAALRAKNRHLKHIETDPNEIRVCHFACTKRSMPFLRTYGKQGCLKMYVPVKSS